MDKNQRTVKSEHDHGRHALGVDRGPLWIFVMLTSLLPIGALFAAAHVSPSAHIVAQKTMAAAKSQAVIRYNDDIDTVHVQTLVRRLEAQGASLTFSLFDEHSEKLEVAFHPDRGLCGKSARTLEIGLKSLHELGANFRFSTRYYIDGRIRDEALQGNLIVVFGGNPLMRHNEVREIMRELHLYGIKKIDGDIRYAFQISESEKTPEGRTGQMSTPEFFFNQNTFIDEPHRANPSLPQTYALSSAYWGNRIIDIPLQYQHVSGLYLSEFGDASAILRAYSNQFARHRRRHYRMNPTPLRSWKEAVRHEMGVFNMRLKGHIVAGHKTDSAILFSIQQSPYLPTILKTLFGEQLFDKHMPIIRDIHYKAGLLKTLNWARRRQRWLFEESLKKVQQHIAPSVDASKNTKSQKQIKHPSNHVHHEEVELSTGQTCQDGFPRLSSRRLLKYLNERALDFEVASDLLAALPTSTTHHMLASDFLNQVDVRGVSDLDDETISFIGFISNQSNKRSKRLAIEIQGGQYSIAERQDMLFQFINALGHL